MTVSTSEQRETDAESHIPPAIDSPRGKLVYLALDRGVGGRSTTYSG